MQAQFRIDADHFQFYLEDRAIEHDTGFLWSMPTVEHRLDVLDGFIAVGTARWGADTAVTIEIHEQSPHGDSLDAWDAVLEASIRTISGQLLLTTPEGEEADAPIIPIPPGSYRVRIYYGQLHSVTDEFEQQGADTYHLIVWPSEPSPPRILKTISPIDPPIRS